MKLLRAATLCVADPRISARRYVEWMGYKILDEGVIAADLAASWGTPLSAGRSFVTIGPASGANVYIRFVAGDAVPAYRPLRTFGWAALEICVDDVLAVNERMLRSPFEVIGPPREIPGLPTIYPMQVKGPDQEIVYLTQIRSDEPEFDLPRAASLIDKLFILVLACSDLEQSMHWFEHHVRLKRCRHIDIVYTMISKSFALAPDQLHTIATMIHDRDVFLELDQYPQAAVVRPSLNGQLPPGIALASFQHPDFNALTGPWIEPPVQRHGPIYDGARAATMRAPDGTLLEIVATS